MTIKIYTFSARRPDLSPAQYKAYYETTHAPLIRSLLGPHAPLAYVRNYIPRAPDAAADDAAAVHYPAQLLMGPAGKDFDFDCVCESTFRDRAHLDRCMEELNRPGKKEVRERDEGMFLDVAKLMVVMVETCGD